MRTITLRELPFGNTVCYIPVIDSVWLDPISDKKEAEIIVNFLTHQLDALQYRYFKLCPHCRAVVNYGEIEKRDGLIDGYDDPVMCNSCYTYYEEEI